MVLTYLAILNYLDYCITLRQASGRKYHHTAATVSKIPFSHIPPDIEKTQFSDNLV